MLIIKYPGGTHSTVVVPKYNFSHKRTYISLHYVVYIAKRKFSERTERANIQACPWESHGKRPMGWDGTAHICMSHEIQK